MGTQRFEAIETDCFRLTHAWFPPHSMLQRHTHDRATLAVMLRGNFRTDIARRRLACDAGFVWTEPLGEVHANVVGAKGAHVLVVQPDDAKADVLAPLARLFHGVHLLQHGGVNQFARRIARELGSVDPLRTLCVEALAMMLLADAARLQSRDGNGHRMPGWLGAARDLLHAGWRSGLTVSAIASGVGVHPVHLTRMFRRYFGASIATYVRKLRLDWALRELAGSRRPIAVIAAEAGFSDQSHLTRECRRHLGAAPAEYRRECATFGQQEIASGVSSER